MAADKSDSSSSSFPWSTIALLLATTGGALLLLAPLKSDRPNAGSTEPSKAIGHSDVDARLWQDPFKAATDYLAVLQKHSRTPDESHCYRVLAKDLRERSRASPTLVLGVMVHAAPYAEYVEERLRSRQAILESLAVSNYLPEDGEHIGVAEFPWCSDRLSSSDKCRWKELDTDLIPRPIPYEWCKYQNLGVNPRPGRTFETPPKYTDVLVLWLPDEAFADVPLTRLAKFFQTLGVELGSAGSPTVKVIGPRTSTTLRQMILDADQPCGGCPEMKTVEIYSASATAADDLLLDHLSNDVHATTVEDFFRWRCGISIYRSIPNDETVLKEMIDELERRQVHVKKRADIAAQHHIAIISEWDTFYGLAIPLSFAKVAGVAPSHRLSLGGLDKDAPWIHTFRYLRGIDGKLPGEAAEATGNTASLEREQSQDKSRKYDQGSQLHAAEDPEGLNQADYLRRLANDLQETDQVLTRMTGGGIQAVGILGTDLYDKLLVLHAVRDRLPGAVFFTTNLDARLSQQSEWSAAHNLVVASGFGLSLNPYYQHEIPPFRESYQTALFASGLKITGILPQDVLYGRPRLYEIGRHGAHDLSLVAPPLPDGSGDNPLYDRAFDANYTNVYENPPLTLQPPRDDMAGWWTSRRSEAVAGMAICVAICLLLLGFVHGWPKTFVVSKLITLTAPWLILSVAATVILLWIVVRWQLLEGVPFALFDGISLWPTEAARFFSGLMCIHLLIKAPLEIQKNENEIQSKFGLNPLASGEAPMIRLHIDDVCVQPGSNLIDPQKLWDAYMLRSRWRSRYLRTAIFSVCYYVFGLCLLRIFGFPTAPVRGNVSSWVDLLTTIWFSVPLLIALTFFVVDCAVLAFRMIQLLDKGKVNWNTTALSQFASRGMPVGDLDDYVTIQLIAMRTLVISEFLYYPFLVLFILVLSRNNWFGNWDWPIGLIIIFGINAALASGAAIVLRRSAENLRASVVRRLTVSLVAYTSAGATGAADAVRETRAEVAEEAKGAFSLFHDHPILNAILLPSGGVGLWAILQYFASNSG